MKINEFTIKTHGLCNPKSIVQGEKYRISVLTESLLRLEYSEDGIFEDRATQTVVNRNFPEVSFEVKATEDLLVIYTKYLEVRYDKKEFTPHGLSIRVTGTDGAGNAWHYGEEPRDLGGTARTLDTINGACPLEHGINSFEAFSIIDDSTTILLEESGWIAPRERHCIDLYFFGYGHRYLEA